MRRRDWEPSSARHSLNAEDRIAFVNEAWAEFASANGGVSLAPPLVLQRPVWDFIADAPTRHIEAEHAVNELRLFADRLPPQLTHGICGDCDGVMLALQQGAPRVTHDCAMRTL